MNSKRLVFILSAIMVLAMCGPGFSAESEIVKRFASALYKKDPATMHSIVMQNVDKIPAETDALLDDALKPQVSKEDRESKFYVAEFMADEYKNVTGDAGLLKSVKTRVFESKIHQPVRPVPVNGVVTIDALSTENEKNLFRPDNIIIKKGNTVKWTNNDNVAHLLASVPVIGLGGMFSPTIEPGQSWTYKFDDPGVYYYICFIHRVMYGKITVE